MSIILSSERLRQANQPQPVKFSDLQSIVDDLEKLNNTSGVGITTINGENDAAQTLVTGTAGADFAIIDLAGVHTFNIPNASAINRGLLTSANFTTFNNKLSPPISVTYAALLVLIGGSTLMQGQQYIISDFQTIHTIPNTAVTNTGGIEPLIVIASTTNTLYENAVSTLFPNDLINYQVVDPTTSGGTKGRIMYREDTLLSISTGYDWRVVKFRRWETAPASGIFTVLTNNAGAFNDYFTFNNSSSATGCYSNKLGSVTTDTVNTNRLNNIVFQSVTHDNIIGDNSFSTTIVGLCNRNNIYSMSNTIMGGVFAQNIVSLNLGVIAGINFTQNTIVSLGATSIGNNFTQNTIDSMSVTSIGNNFLQNIIGPSFNNSGFVIGNDFQRNTIGSDWETNTIGDGFIDNTIGSRFISNIIGNDFARNVWGNSTTNGGNTIGDGASDNIFGSQFLNNIVGTDFTNNQVGSNCQGNTFGNGCANNIIADNLGIVGSNVMGDGFSFNNIINAASFFSNTIGDGFINNSIACTFANNTVVDDFQSNILENMLGGLFGVDFSLSNFVYQTYTKHVFKRSDGSTQLSYIDNTNTIQYAAVDA